MSFKKKRKELFKNFFDALDNFSKFKKKSNENDSRFTDLCDAVSKALNAYIKHTEKTPENYSLSNGDVNDCKQAFLEVLKFWNNEKINLHQLTYKKRRILVADMQGVFNWYQSKNLREQYFVFLQELYNKKVITVDIYKKLHDIAEKYLVHVRELPDNNRFPKNMINCFEFVFPVLQKYWKDLIEKKAGFDRSKYEKLTFDILRQKRHEYMRKFIKQFAPSDFVKTDFQYTKIDISSLVICDVYTKFLKNGFEKEFANCADNLCERVKKLSEIDKDLMQLLSDVFDKVEKSLIKDDDLIDEVMDKAEEGIFTAYRLQQLLPEDVHKDCNVLREKFDRIYMFFHGVDLGKYKCNRFNFRLFNVIHQHTRDVKHKKQRQQLYEDVIALEKLLLSCNDAKRKTQYLVGAGRQISMLIWLLRVANEWILNAELQSLKWLRFINVAIAAVLYGQRFFSGFDIKNIKQVDDHETNQELVSVISLCLGLKGAMVCKEVGRKVTAKNLLRYSNLVAQKHKKNFQQDLKTLQHPARQILRYASVGIQLAMVFYPFASWPGKIFQFCFTFCCNFATKYVDELLMRFFSGDEKTDTKNTKQPLDAKKLCTNLTQN
ncbi:MAG: hypothetical protein PVG30_00035 [Gammaproteobacteria bacterium]|jgi:hypothetical protein